jgi:hypothetical protein
MSVLYRCDECAEVAEAEAAVGWVEMRELGGRPLLPPVPHHLCRLCRTATPCSDGARAGPADAVATRAGRRGSSPQPPPWPAVRDR